MVVMYNPIMHMMEVMLAGAARGQAEGQLPAAAELLLRVRAAQAALGTPGADVAALFAPQ